MMSNFLKCSNNTVLEMFLHFIFFARFIRFMIFIQERENEIYMYDRNMLGMGKVDEQIEFM